MKVITKDETKQFILDTLLPYKNDNKTCGYDFELDVCLYLTQDGRTCAVGKHLDKNKAYYSEIIESENKSSVDTLANNYKLKEVLTDEALKFGLTNYQWEIIQIIHDNYAKKLKLIINGKVILLANLLNINLDELLV